MKIIISILLASILVYGIMLSYYGLAIRDESYAIVERSKILENKVDIDFQCCTEIDEENIGLLTKGFSFLNKQSIDFSGDVIVFLNSLSAFLAVIFLALIVAIFLLFKQKAAHEEKENLKT